jgi:hypothetical protein
MASYLLHIIKDLDLLYENYDIFYLLDLDKNGFIE